MIDDKRLYEIMKKSTLFIFDENEIAITGIEKGAKEYAKEVALDFLRFYELNYRISEKGGIVMKQCEAMPVCETVTELYDIFHSPLKQSIMPQKPKDPLPDVAKPAAPKKPKGK